MATLKPQSNRPQYSNTVFGTIHWLAVGMGGLLHLVQRGGAWVGCGPAQFPPHCTKCYSPPVNSHCTNFDVALYRVGQIKRGQLIFLLVTSELIYKIT